MGNRYRVKDDVRVETNHALHGRIVREFEAGDVTAKNETDEILLEMAVDHKVAERLPDEPRPRKAKEDFK